MPVDAGVYGQFAQPVRSVTDIQNGLAQQQTNALAAQHSMMQMQQMRTDMADSNALRAAYRGGADPSTPEGRQALIQAAPLQAPAIFKSQADLAKTQADTKMANAHASDFDSQTQLRQIQKTRDSTSLLAQQLTGVNSPQDTVGWYQAGIKSGLISPDDALAEINKVPTDPQGFAQWKAQQQQKGMSVMEQQTQQFKQLQLASEEKRATATNQTHLQGIAAQQSGENSRAALGRQTQLTVAGLGADGAPNGSLDGMVDLIGTGKMQPPTGLALRNPRIVALMEQVAQKYPNFDATDYGARQLAAKSFSTGRDGQSVQSANTALNHLDTLRQLATAQNNGDIRTVNDIKNRISKEFGGTAPANLQAAVTMVGPEISRAVIGAGGGQGDRDKVDAALASLVKGGPDQQAGTIGTMQDLFGGRLTEAQRTYERTTGRKDFADTLLSPAAQKVLAARSGSTSDSADLHSKAQAILRGGK